MSHALRIVALRHGSRRRRRAVRDRSARAGGVVGAFLLLTVMSLAVISLASISALGVVSKGLPDPAALASLSFAEPTVLFDRDGSVELARFEQDRREVVDFADIPKHVLDATTSAEDRTFWTNVGIDPAALLAASVETASGVRERGGSTITQQLVRARLLPEDVVAAGSDRYVRKVKEIIQSLRITDAFPGDAGKRRIVSAYLNEVFFGHRAYGIAAAARTYFDVDVGELTVAQAALLAGLVKSPTLLDPFRFAERDDDGRLRVDPGSEPVVRRDWILRAMAVSSRWTKLSSADLAAAIAEPVILADDVPAQNRGGHFTWQVRRQLQAILGPDVDLDAAGYRVITTLDWRAQRLAEKWLAAAVIAPNLSKARSADLLADLKVGKGDRRWIGALRGKDLHNGSLVAMDHVTGDILAYVGSAGYGRDDLASRRFEPKYDAAGDGARQPGSAFKPILYAAAFDQRRLTPGSLLLDVTTTFDKRADWAPRDADRLDRGPVLVRRALQYSLNVPAVRALHRVGSKAVADTAARMGIEFHGGRDAFLRAGLAGALGTVETTPLDLTTAFATLGNGGVRVAPRMILKIFGPDGSVIWTAPEQDGPRAISAQAAYLVTDVLAGNSDARQNPIWAKQLTIRNGPDGERRPAAVKTGTTNDARDLGTYGYLPDQPDGGPGLTVGVWLGNSDHSNPRARVPATSLTAAAPLWRAFVRDYTDGWPITRFKRPKEIVSSRIDAWSGGRPGPWTRATTTEWFIEGTEPGRRDAVDQDGLLYRRMCGTWRVDPVGAELGARAWRPDVADWLRRARGGTGVLGDLDSRTAYFWGERSWGGSLAGPCPRPRPVERDGDKDDDRDRDEDDDGEDDGDDGDEDDDGGDEGDGDGDGDGDDRP